MSQSKLSELPIGVFDSGVGGLTVLKALQETLPHEHFLYLGDTARLPYGMKTPKTISAYAVQATRFLLSQGIKILVIACNTATALALPTLQQQFPDLLIVGVINPGAKAAMQASGNKQIAVIATEATVNSKGYEQALMSLNPSAKVAAWPASLLVALAEEGFFTGAIPRLVVEHYLAPILADKNIVADTLILGCTHFPVLRLVIEDVVAGRMHLIDSAQAVAEEVRALLAVNPELVRLGQDAARTKFLVTDGVGRFMRIAQIFLNKKPVAEDVALVDLNFTA